MFPSDLENAYAYEKERRKDEMRDAAKSQLVPQRFPVRASQVRRIAILSIPIWLLISFLVR